MSDPISPEAAWDRIAAALSALSTERVQRTEAHGRVLAEDLRATADQPAHDLSAMDGYAIEGSPAPGTALIVTGTIAAGDAPGFVLSTGTAARIMTGAPVPLATTSVIPIELTDGGKNEAILHRTVPAGAHIRRQGEVARAGDLLLTRGELLTPGALALAATHGHRDVLVHRLPRVASLATGNEVVHADRDPGPGQLRDSHTDFLRSAGRSLGLEFEPLGIAADSSEATLDAMRRGLGHDVLLVSGGVSMGAFDFVEAALPALGCELLIDAVAIQPGKPLVVARHPGGWVFGLPGNPASVMVSFWLFVRPLLRALQGFVDGFWHGALEGELIAGLPGAKDRDRFFPAEVRTRDGRIVVRPMPPKGSHDLMAYARGRALVRIRPGTRQAEAGEVCEVLPLLDWPLANAR